MPYPNELKYFMWAYQVHFRIGCEIAAEQIFNKLDRGLRPSIFLIGLLSEPKNNKPAICIEPENLEYLLSELSAVPKEQKLEQSSNTRRLFYTGEGVQEKMDKRNAEEDKRRELQNQLRKHKDFLDSKIFVSKGREVNGYTLYIVLELNKQIYESHIHLENRRADDRFNLSLSFLESTVKSYLEDILKSLSNPSTDEFYDSNSLNYSEVLRKAAEDFCYTVSWAGREGRGLHGIVEKCNQISKTKYEGKELIGSMLIAKRNHPNIDMSIELVEPFLLADFRKSRKLLQQTDGQLSLISNGWQVFGLGKKLDTYNPIDESIFGITFTGLHCWEISHDKFILLQYRHGIPQFSEESIDKKLFNSIAKRIFQNISDRQILKLYNLSKTLTGLKKGAMLIISDIAKTESARLSNQCMCMKPINLDETMLKNLTAIDGGILVDRKGKCFANGVLLDGIVGKKGDSSRGSRFNSALTYQEGKEFKTGLMIIVVSEDGMIDLIPNLLPKIKHSDIISAINLLSEINKSGNLEGSSYNETMEFLKNREFYLSAQECQKINRLKRSISKKLDRSSVQVIYPNLKPNPEMDHHYYDTE